MNPDSNGQDQDPAARPGTTGSPAVLPHAPAWPPGRPQFLVTKEHRRFAEFADACRRDRYIGLCYGPPGVGKTLSARQYAHGTTSSNRCSAAGGATTPPGATARTSTPSLYTPTLNATPRILDNDHLPAQSAPVSHRAAQANDPRTFNAPHGSTLYTELLVIDEADRLKTPATRATPRPLRPEPARHDPDRHARHRETARPLPAALQPDRVRPPVPAAIRDELAFVLPRHWPALGLSLPPTTSPTPRQSPRSPASPAGTSASFTPLRPDHPRPGHQRPAVISKEVVETARESLVIGTL